MPQKTSRTFTYQTRISTNETTNSLLTETAILLSKVERSLFADFQKQKKEHRYALHDFKCAYLIRFQITARHFNSCRMQLEGKIRSYKEHVKERISLLKTKCKKLKDHIGNLKDSSKIHQKKRRLYQLQKKLEKLEKDQEEGKLRICFGGKKLFRSQFHLQENGFESVKDWKKEWESHRNSSFFVVGSKDETCGNQTCQMVLKQDGTFRLTLRLPNGFAKKTITMEGISFPYGEKEILECIRENEKRKQLRLQKDPSYSRYGRALNYRFKRDEKGWRIFVSIEKQKPAYVSKKELGSMGIDSNTNQIALVEIDRFGNPIKKEKLSLSIYGKTKEQRKAIIGDVSKKIVNRALEAQKPIILERLDFERKKQTLREASNKFSRTLSSFAYREIHSMIQSRAWRNDIETIEINPAFTTVIGRIKFAKRYGLSSHLSAALIIARRSYKYSEKPPRYLEELLDNTSHKIAFSLPVRNREKHVWGHYREVSKNVKAVLAAHTRTKNLRSINTLTPVDETAEASENYRGSSYTRIVNNTVRLTCQNKSINA
jgi:IS605 OrfB family transposase